MPTDFEAAEYIGGGKVIEIDGMPPSYDFSPIQSLTDEDLKGGDCDAFVVEDMPGLKISVEAADGSVVWMRDMRSETPNGIASRGHVADGTQARIIAALRIALRQAEFEMSAFDIADIVADVGAPAA